MFDKKLQTIILVVLVCLSSAMLFLGLVINYQFQTRLLIQQTQTLTEQNVARSVDSIQTMISMLENTSQSIVRQLNLSVHTKEDIQRLLNNSVELHHDILSLSVVDEQGNITQHAPIRFHARKSLNFYDQAWYTKEEQYDQSLYSKPHIQQLFRHQSPMVISNTIPFNWQQSRYLLVIDYKMEMLERFFEGESIGKSGYSFIVDRYHDIIYHPYQTMEQDDAYVQQLDFGKMQQMWHDEAQNTIIAAQRVPLTQWHVVGKTDVRSLIAQTQRRIVAVSSLIFGMLFIAIAILSYVAANYIAKPIQALSLRMSHWAPTDVQLRVDEQAPYDEAVQLNASYNQLQQEITQLMATIKAEEATLRKSERMVLEAQIQPHFLYNTLESILWMIESGNTSEASLMVRSLGKLLRISLSNGDTLIPLAKEFEQVTSYLEIQALRYKHQFDYNLELDESLADVWTIKLLLQPLVENAIYHGISRLVDEGSISIKAYRVDDVIEIAVSDTGQGIAPDRLEALRQHLQQKNQTFGIGIRNVHERLRIYFGESYGLHIESELDEGTTVILRMPLLTSKEEIQR